MHLPPRAPGCNPHHQVYYIFSRESFYINLYLPRLHPGWGSRSKVCNNKKHKKTINKFTTVGEKKQPGFVCFPVPPKNKILGFCMFFSCNSRSWSWKHKIGFWRPIICAIKGGQWEKHPKNSDDITTDCSWKAHLDFSYASHDARKSCHKVVMTNTFVWDAHAPKVTKIEIWQQLHHDDRYIMKRRSETCAMFRHPPFLQKFPVTKRKSKRSELYSYHLTHPNW